jgi:hypothetical protein
VLVEADEAQIGSAGSAPGRGGAAATVQLADVFGSGISIQPTGAEAPTDHRAGRPAMSPLTELSRAFRAAVALR